MGGGAGEDPNFLNKENIRSFVSFCFFVSYYPALFSYIAITCTWGLCMPHTEIPRKPVCMTIDVRQGKGDRLTLGMDLVFVSISLGSSTFREV